MELIKLVESLSEKEQERLELYLTPVVAARKAYMDFVTIEIPKDTAKLEEIQNRRTSQLLQSDAPEDKAKLAELDEELKKIRTKIDGAVEDGWRKSGHIVQCETLQKELTKAKENFARHY